MQDKELYQQVLGLADPWSVDRVELNMAKQRVEIWVEHEPEAGWSCPECGRSLGCYDHAAQRTWRHLDTCQLQTHLHARVPRVKCPEHGVHQVKVKPVIKVAKMNRLPLYGMIKSLPAHTEHRHVSGLSSVYNYRASGPHHDHRRIACVADTRTG